MGSTSYIPDASGEVYQHLEYFAFGGTFVEEHSNTDRTPYLFNGKELDEETGLYYYGARYYDEQTSIWLSVDRYSEKYPHFNPYSFSANNPLLYIDPTGDTIRVHGSDEFITKYKADRSKIAKTNEGRALLKTLDESKEDIYISEATTLKDDVLTFLGFEGDTDENNLMSSETSQSAGGDVNLEYSQVEGVEISGAISESHHTLNHELNHARDFVDGTFAEEVTKDYNGKTARVNGETRAVESTNRIRKREGKPLRTEYDFRNGKVIKFKTP